MKASGTKNEQKLPPVHLKDHNTKFNVCITKRIEEGMRQGKLVELGQPLCLFGCNKPITWTPKPKSTLEIIEDYNLARQVSLWLYLTCTKTTTKKPSP